MKILVTGQDGFIAKNMMAWIIAENWDVDGWSWCPDSMPDVKNYQWVIHLGAVTDPLETDVDKLLLQNYEFSKKLFELCQEHEVNLQFASTSDVYGMGKSKSKSKTYTEFDVCKPVTPYAWSKYLFDRWVFQQPITDSVVQGFRYFNVYGRYMHLSGHKNILTQYRNQARGYHKITVDNNADNIKRDWVWVGDVCRLHIDFIKTVRGSGLWNCGSGLAHSDRALAEEIARQEDVPIEIIDSPEISHKGCANLKHLKSTIGRRKWLNIFEYLNQ